MTGATKRARGGKTSFADLAKTIGEKSVVDSHSGVDGVFRAGMPVEELAPNPENPRDDIGSLDDLSSLAERQLQPLTVISKSVWLRVYPEHNEALADAKFVVVNGCRRLAAARHFGVPGLDVVIRDAIASDRASVLRAAILENVARRDFDVIEEAKAVERMVTEIGNARDAAATLGKSEGWVSQRRSLLKLTPELQEKLRSGELLYREARSLARVPQDEQVNAWLDRQKDSSDNPPPSPSPTPSPASRDDEEEVDDVERVVRSVRRLSVPPVTLGVALLEAYSESEISVLVRTLSSGTRDS